MIFNIVIDGPSPPNDLILETSYRGISRYSNNKMVLTTDGMKVLRSLLSFTQLRFHCSKQQGRTFHVTTAANSSGEGVVQYFSRQTDVQPDACGSFVRIKGDNSVLAGNCSQWGIDNVGVKVGKWGHWGLRELYKFPAFIVNTYHWSTSPYYDAWGYRFECDDAAGRSVSSGDFWKIYVR